VVVEEVRKTCSERELLGLHINVDKCELVCRLDFISSAPSLKHFSLVNLEYVSLIGAPLFNGKALDDALDRCCSDLTRACLVQVQYLLRLDNIT